MTKPEIRNPKSETNHKLEIPNRDGNGGRVLKLGACAAWDLGFGVSFGFRVSDFGFPQRSVTYG